GPRGPEDAVKRDLAVVAVAIALALAALGCALTGKSDAMVPRFFTLEPAAHATTTTAARVGAASAPQLRLGRVTAADHIEQPIIYRQSEREIGFYDDRLWSEKPDAYLGRALGRVLFEEKGLRRAVAGRAP